MSKQTKAAPGEKSRPTGADPEIIAALANIDGVSIAPYGDTGLMSLEAKGKSIGHFHRDGSLDLRLTKRVIAAEALTHPTDSVQHPKRSPNSPWIELPCHPDAADELERLVKLAVEQR